MIFLIPVLLLTIIGIVFGVLIAFFSKKFEVKTDKMVEDVLLLLSGANCGACGFAGCEDFAKALVEGKASLALCNSTSKEGKLKISALLGTEASISETTVVCACGGGNLCEDKYDYQGYGDCSSVEMLAGGRKTCPSGCIGMSTCVVACPEQAISIVQGVAVVDNKACINCGVCIIHCPKNIMKRIPIDKDYYIACSTSLTGKNVRTNCKMGCIACAVCVKACPEGALSMVNNLPVFDYSKCNNCGICASKCPVKCIKKIEKSEEAE